MKRRASNQSRGDICTVRAFTATGVLLGVVDIDGRDALSNVADRVERGGDMVGRVTITNSTHGVQWTWEREP